MNKTRFFIFIMALMMTLLMVVGCDVSPVSEVINAASSYVEFKLSVKGPNTREIKIDSSNCIVSNYRIALIPEWNTLENGAPIYGKIGSRDLDGTVTYGDTTYTSVDQITLGYVTPGKWTVYVAAFNADNKVVLDGYTSTYVNSSNNTVSVCLSPSVTTVSESGSLNFYFTVPRLSDDHLASYGVRYTLYNSSNSIYSSGDIPGHAFFDKSQVWYYFDSDINDLNAGEYIINIVLYDKKDNSSIGGITKKLSIVSGTTTNVGGSLSPSEFIDVKLDYKLPVINAVVEKVDPLLPEVKDSAIVFTCTDNSKKTDGYFRTFRWFIDGELITKVSSADDVERKWTVTAMSDNDTSSSITCKFNSYGKREIRCEVVYIPVVSEGEDDSKLIRLIGGDSKFVEIIPR